MNGSSGTDVDAVPSKASLCNLQAAQDIIVCARQVQNVTTDTDSRLDRWAETASSLSRNPADAVVQRANNASVEHITSRIMSLGLKDARVRHLLHHFEPNLKTIIRKVLTATTHDETVWWRTIEECYNASINSAGALHIDNYFDAVNDTPLQSPFDPEIGNEQYYDYENHSAVDDNCVQKHSWNQNLQWKRQLDNRREMNQAWLRFWAEAVTDCIDGPTLFWPFTAEHIEDLARPPRYLFRAFDSSSSGASDETVVASLASISEKPKVSKADLLSLGRKEAGRRLCAHLNKDCFTDASCLDNLMSWSSSLLFVIQYAIWRCMMRQSLTSDIKIIAVDTTKFPLGQFAQDTWLLQNCHNTADEDADMQKILNLRANGWDNGEYLSQGTLHHKGRSSIATLEKLEQAGLYNLYPELNDPVRTTEAGVDTTRPRTKSDKRGYVYYTGGNSNCISHRNGMFLGGYTTS